MIDDFAAGMEIASFTEIAAPRRARPKRQRQPLTRPSPALLAVLAASLALMAALGLRERIVRVAPSLAGAYAVIGLPVNLSGLEIGDLRSRLEQQGGATLLAVEGRIVNIRHHAIAVPRVQIAVEAADGHAIYTWTAAAPKARLARGESIDFRARLSEPPEGGRKVRVEFAAAGE